MRWVYVVTAVVLLVVVASVAASGQSVDRALEECMEVSDEEIGRGLPTCAVDAEGNVISRTFPEDPVFGEPTSPFGDSPGPDFGTIVVFAILWAAIPFGIAAYAAHDRGESA